MYEVNCYSGVMSRCYHVQSKTEHEAYKQFLSLLEADGLKLDDLDGFTLTEI